MGRVVNFFDPVLQFAPYLGHVAQTAKYAGQGDGIVSGTARAIMPNMTGFKARGIDEEDVLREQQRLLTEMITEDPMMQTWTDVYLPAATKEALENGELSNDELLNLLEQKSRIAAQLKGISYQRKAAER